MIGLRNLSIVTRGTHSQAQPVAEVFPPSWAPPLVRRPPPPLRKSTQRPGRMPEGGNTKPSPTKIRFNRLDFDTGVATLIRSKGRIYKSPFFTLRCVPAKIVPPPPSSPFPSISNTKTSILANQDDPSNVVRFGVMTSKKAVSNFAVERNRARTRFKAVVADILKSAEGGSLITPFRAYLAVLDGKIAYGNSEEIREDVLKAMRYLASPSLPSNTSNSPFVRSGFKSTRSANQKRTRGAG